MVEEQIIFEKLNSEFKDDEFHGFCYDCSTTLYEERIGYDIPLYYNFVEILDPKENITYLLCKDCYSLLVHEFKNENKVLEHLRGL